MDSNNTPSENKKSQVQKISETSYHLMKDSQTYLMNITYNDQNLNINVKRSFFACEANYTLADLHAVENFFAKYDSLRDIFEELTIKFDAQSVEFNEEVGQFTLKFEFIVGLDDVTFEEVKSAFVLTLKKIPAENLEGLEQSRIIKTDEVEQIQNWIGGVDYNKVSFKLLYRATEHGTSHSDFHSRCDNKVRLIILSLIN